MCRGGGGGCSVGGGGGCFNKEVDLLHWLEAKLEKRNNSQQEN